MFKTNGIIIFLGTDKFWDHQQLWGNQARNQLVTPGEAKSFLRGIQTF